MDSSSGAASPPPTETTATSTATTATTTTSASADTAVAITDSEKLKRKRQPRNSACQGCAALKMKCIATANGKCERCNRMDRDCVPAVPKPRKRRTHSASGLETPQGQHGLPLSEILGAQSSPTTRTASLPKFEPPPPLPPKRVEYQNGSSRESLLSHPDPAQTSSRSFTSLFAHGLGNLAATNDDLLRGVDQAFVKTSFNVFRQANSYFPFVDVPAATDLMYMATQRPVLTVAICAVAAANQPEMQSRLNQAFRYALSTKVMVNGERSIDLLTGLLVYLAWHHHYMSQQQIYQQLCLLAGMVADLDLHQNNARPQQWGPAGILERDRAFVGCYYLSSSLSSVGFAKPSPLRWTDNLRRCAENVARTGSLPSDRALVAIVELVHVLDDLEHALRFDASTNITSPSYPLAVDLHAKAANQRLKALKREYPSLGGTLGFAAASIHVYHRLLQSGQPPDYPTLIQCACAVKEYLDDLLARPASTLHQLAIVDWIFLLEILVLMARIARPAVPDTTPRPGGASASATNSSGSSANRGRGGAVAVAVGWEVGALASMLQPEALLDALYARMAATPAHDLHALRDESLLRWFGALCDGIKSGMLRNDGGGGGGGGPLRHLSDGVLHRDFMQALTTTTTTP